MARGRSRRTTTSPPGGSSRPSSPPTCYQVATRQRRRGVPGPEAFFRRTYLTERPSRPAVGAARRLRGDGGDPVIELQTNFGGGKTHSMIALYHLASGMTAGELPGVGELLAERGLVSLPPTVKRAVLVGQMDLARHRRTVKADGTEVHTLWGELA